MTSEESHNHQNIISDKVFILRDCNLETLGYSSLESPRNKCVQTTDTICGEFTVTPNDVCENDSESRQIACETVPQNKKNLKSAAVMQFPRSASRIAADGTPHASATPEDIVPENAKETHDSNNEKMSGAIVHTSMPAPPDKSVPRSAPLDKRRSAVSSPHKRIPPPSAGHSDAQDAEASAHEADTTHNHQSDQYNPIPTYSRTTYQFSGSANESPA